MNKYNIKVYNGSGAIVYDDRIEEENEEKALLAFIKNVATITSGDTIKIEEI